MPSAGARVTLQRVCLRCCLLSRQGIFAHLAVLCRQLEQMQLGGLLRKRSPGQDEYQVGVWQA